MAKTENSVVPHAFAAGHLTRGINHASTNFVDGKRPAGDAANRGRSQGHKDVWPDDGALEIEPPMAPIDLVGAVREVPVRRRIGRLED